MWAHRRHFRYGCNAHSLDYWSFAVVRVGGGGSGLWMALGHQRGDMLMLNHLLILTIAPLADETSPVAFRQG